MIKAGYSEPANSSRRAGLIVALAMILAVSLSPASMVHADSPPPVPTPPWGPGDEKGMANTQGPGTWARCAHYLTAPGAKSYELSHLRSNTMPTSPFGAPLDYTFRPTIGLPSTRHAFNGESSTGETGAQGTQMDALGHFAYLNHVWSGTGDFPSQDAHYYGGYTQAEVKPTPNSPLLKLGIDKAPPIITSAVLLDARTSMGKGESLKAGALITAADIESMLVFQGLGHRGILPGDALFIYTGWEDHWADPDTEKLYYTMGPGLSTDAVKYIQHKAIVLVSLDNPFTDPVKPGQLAGRTGPAKGTPKGLPYISHHQNLTQSGIHQIQNAHLEELARDKVWLSCVMILPLRIKGASGSPVRPVAIGASFE